ncbi:MAG: ABC transporter permease [Gemmatimonadota bacterium]
MRTRWLKLWRDVQDAPGRLLMIVGALVVSLVAVVAMLVSFIVLRREVPRSFLAANPASARLSLDGDVSPAMLGAVRARRDIAKADASGFASAQLLLPDGEALPVVFFVVPEFSPQRVDALYAENGPRLHGDGMLLIERSALALTRAGIGDGITLVLPRGGRRRVAIAATVHDPGVAPAWQEQVIYAYATQATMRALGEPVVVDQLKLVMRDTTASTAAIDGIVREIMTWIPSQGRTVLSAQVPPLRQHPHQPQMNAIITMLLAFSLLGMALGTVLTATVIGAMLAQQVRQLAIMKAIGARSAQLRTMYLTLVGVLGATAVLIAVPLGVLGGRRLVAIIGTLLNLRIESLALPWWLYAAAIALGVGAPALATALPIRRAARRTVRQAIDDHDARMATDNDDRLARWLARLRIRDVATTLAARNAFRRRGRLLMTTGLLAGAGAMCIASLDLRAAWEAKVSTAIRDRHFDVEIRLRDPIPRAQLAALAARLPMVDAIEGWNGAGAVREEEGDSADVGRVHGDGGHGALAYREAAPGTDMIAHRMAKGRWLATADSDAVVLNSMARDHIFADVRVGELVRLRVNGTTRPLRVVGIMHESLTQSTAYVTPATFARHTGYTDGTGNLRVRMRERQPDSVSVASRALVQALDASGIGVRRVITSSRMAAAQGGHVYILVATLGAIALVMAVVGLIGLASALGVSVFERTREFGVMRAIGATRRIILQVVLLEGVFIALLSLVPAVLVSRAVSLTVGGVLASVAQQDLVLSLSPPGVLVWALALSICAAIVSAFPASRAAGLTVRDAISHT